MSAIYCQAQGISIFLGQAVEYENPVYFFYNMNMGDLKISIYTIQDCSLAK